MFCLVYDVVMEKVCKTVEGALRRDVKEQRFFFTVPLVENTAGNVSIASGNELNKSSISWSLLVCDRHHSQLWLVDPLGREMPSEFFQVMVPVWKIISGPLKAAKRVDTFPVPLPKMLNHKLSFG